MYICIVYYCQFILCFTLIYLKKLTLKNTKLFVTKRFSYVIKYILRILKKIKFKLNLNLLKFTKTKCRCVIGTFIYSFYLTLNVN